MNTRMITLLIAVLFAGLLMLNGCKKSEPTSTQTSGHTHKHDDGTTHADHEHADHAHEEATEAVTAAIEQKTCPVMEGNPIKTKYFVEYKGKKVYFCCPGCDKKFLENPEQYIAKLPQFNQ